MCRASKTLCVELLAGADHLQGPTAAMVDVLQVLNAVARLRGAKQDPLNWQWCAADGRALRRAGSGTRRLRWPDLFVVPGWLARNGAHLSRLVERDHGAAARALAVHCAGGQVLGLYTGVALLGQAGLLEQRRAAVPWPFIPSVLRHAPHLQPAEGEAWVEQDGVWTADSPTLATELLLRALQACGLDDLAEAGRAVLLHTPERQRLVKAVARASTARVGPGTLERARRWLEDHWHERYDLGAAARAAATSERSLLRHFRAAFGHTPLQHVHQLRITHARILLETTYLPIEAIAERCGWHDAASLRTVFARHTGSTPAAYRERHRLRSTRRQWGQDLCR
jgi:transcriptional regulator GlxA family with amidase domain